MSQLFRFPNAVKCDPAIDAWIDHPTQQVRDILGNAASEELCREFLSGIARAIKGSISDDGTAA
ncbi:MAG: hypothetical protein ABI451_08210 [Dokdonella sp.]